MTVRTVVVWASLVTLLSGAAAQAQTAAEPTPPPLLDLPTQLPLDAVEEPQPPPSPEEEQADEPVKLPRKVWGPDKSPGGSARLLRPALSMPTRVFLEFGGGLAAMATAIAVGVPLGCVVDSVITASSGPGAQGCHMFSVLGPAALSLLALPVGVYLAGDVVNPGGSLGATIVGYLVGGLALIPAGVLIGLAGSAFTPIPFVAGLTVMAALLPFAGSIMGYELSVQAGSTSRGDEENEDDKRLSFSPFAGPTADGAAAGFALRF